MQDDDDCNDDLKDDDLLCLFFCLYGAASALLCDVTIDVYSGRCTIICFKREYESD